jgi:hypothetical protein
LEPAYQKTKAMLRKDFDQLSPAEQKAYYRLYKVDGTNPWAIKIRQITRDGNAADFKKLLEELTSEGIANPPVMESIIGKVAFDAVLRVENSLV